MNVGQVLVVLLALGGVVGALVLVRAALGRLPGARGPVAGAGIEVLQRVALGPRQGVAVLRIRERLLVVGLTDAGVRLLTELDEHEDALLQESGPIAPAAAVPAGGARAAHDTFLNRHASGWRGARAASWWARLGLGVLLAASACGTARAQAPATAPAATAPAASAAPAAKASGAPVLASGQRIATPSAPVTPPLRVMPPNAPIVNLRLEGSGFELSGAVGLVVFLGLMTLLPALVLLMTSFTRILIVLHFLRSALGTQTAPPTQLLVAIALLLTGVVMQPALDRTYKEALQPYMEGRITQVEAYTRGIEPFRGFMLANTREQDLATFVRLSHAEEPETPEQVGTLPLVSAFVTSELRTAFQMGFVLFLPFVVIDIVVASVLMSLGMFMLPPIMVSLPLKLLLFVLVDGWSLVFQSLVASFR